MYIIFVLINARLANTYIEVKTYHVGEKYGINRNNRSSI